MALSLCPPASPLSAPSQCPALAAKAMGSLGGGWQGCSEDAGHTWYVAGIACPEAAQLPVQRSQWLIIGRSCKIKFKNE